MKVTTKEDKHYKHQADFFNSEFSKSNEYKLVAWHRAYIKKIYKYLLKNNFKGKTLLDIGAGGAYVTVETAKMGLKVIALDLSKTALSNILRYKNIFMLKNITTIFSNAERLPLKSHSVDYIVANAILEHLPNETKAIHEWKRVLKPGGRMMITVPLKFQFVWPFLWPVNYIHDKQIGHLRRYDLEDLKKKFDMKVIAHFYTGHLLKVLWVIYSVLFNSDILDKLMEVIDERGKHRRYGASNIIVILEK